MTTRYNVNMHNDETIANLVDQNVPPELISTRKGNGNSTYSYLTPDVDVDRLNEIFGPLGWDIRKGESSVTSYVETREEYGNKVEKRVFCVDTEVTLRIKKRSPESSDTKFTQSGVGTGDCNVGKDPKQAISLAIKTAESDGMKRCCSLLGKAFGLFLTNDGLQDDINYAHKNNGESLKKAKAIRTRNQKNNGQQSGNQQSGNQQSGNQRPKANVQDKPQEKSNASNQSNSNNQSDQRNNDQSKAIGDTKRASTRRAEEPQAESPKADTQEKANNEPAPNSSQQSNAANDSEGNNNSGKIKPDDNFNLDNEPLTRQDQISFGATIKRKLKELTEQQERVNLVTKHRNTILGMDSRLCNHTIKVISEYDIDLHKLAA